MRNIIPLFIVGTLVLAAIGAVAVPKAEETLVTTENLQLSSPMFEQADSYLKVTMTEATSLLLDTGKPVVPVVSKVYSFPLGTTVHEVSVAFSDVETITLGDKIIPAPQPIPRNARVVSNDALLREDSAVYTSHDFYPAQNYIVQKGAGLKDGENVMYVVVRCYPVQYAPASDLLQVANNIDISVSYDLPTSAPTFMDEADMLVITPQSYVSILQPLVDHKEANGMTVLVKTTEEIYSGYPAGRDEPEKIKLCIHDMKETYNIKYVLLGGGRKGQTQNWLVPERRNLNDDGWESGFATDLYYADIYKLDGNTTVFEDWDSNGNDVFAEYQSFSAKDVMDFYPDVIIGRLPFRYSFEARNVVQKIIDYETAGGGSWFNDVAMVAGDTFPAGDNAYEGELENQVAIDWLESIGFNIEKLWTSEGTLTGEADVTAVVNGGLGFLYFAGHGNPSTWSTHPPHDEHTWITGASLKNVFGYKNGGELPMMVVGGCHNAQFNTTMANILHDMFAYGFQKYWKSRFYYMEWVPRDWSSSFLLNPNGGSIGSIGMSSLGYGYNSYFTTEGLGGWLDPRFFDAYVNNSKDHMGDAHSQAITDYINIIGNVNSDQIDRKTIEAWTLLGDPSVKLGGL